MEHIGHETRGEMKKSWNRSQIVMMIFWAEVRKGKEKKGEKNREKDEDHLKRLKARCTLTDTPCSLHILNRRKERRKRNRRKRRKKWKGGERRKREMSISQHWVVRTSTGIAILFKVIFSTFFPRSNICWAFSSYFYLQSSGDDVVPGCDNHIFVDGHNTRCPTFHAG